MSFLRKNLFWLCLCGLLNGIVSCETGGRRVVPYISSGHFESALEDKLTLQVEVRLFNGEDRGVIISGENKLKSTFQIDGNNSQVYLSSGRVLALWVGDRSDTNKWISAKLMPSEKFSLSYSIGTARGERIHAVALVLVDKNSAATYYFGEMTGQTRKVLVRPSAQGGGSKDRGLNLEFKDDAPPVDAEPPTPKP